jgi:hypothetical protein
MQGLDCSEGANPHRNAKPKSSYHAPLCSRPFGADLVERKAAYARSLLPFRHERVILLGIGTLGIAMLDTQIFICHSDDTTAAAASIANSLRGRGYKVFLDQDSLPPGRSYDERIEKAITHSSVIIFLISPHSVQEGRYTLTELKFAAKKWPHAGNAVLPVMVAPTEISSLPEYLKGATILTPKGNLAAEVSHEVARLVPTRSRTKLLALAAIAAAIVISIIAIATSRGPSSTPAPGFTQPAPASNYSAAAAVTVPTTALLAQAAATAISGNWFDATLSSSNITITQHGTQFSYTGTAVAEDPPFAGVPLDGSGAGHINGNSLDLDFRTIFQTGALFTGHCSGVLRRPDVMSWRCRDNNNVEFKLVWIR